MKYSSEIVLRPRYTESLIPFIDKPIIKVLTGQRRVGKSYLLLQLQKTILQRNTDAQIIYINKEDYQFDFIKNEADLIAYVQSKLHANHRNYLMVDEIQEIAAFEKAIRHLALQDRLDLYITGSNAHLLGGELSTFLGGRYIECKVYALSFFEFCAFMVLEPNEAALQHYLDWGGLPFLRHLERRTTVIEDYLKTVSHSIIFKDVIQRFGVRNTVFLENLVQYLAANTGNIISAKSISDYLKAQRIAMAPQVVLNYLDHLCSAMLIFKVRRKDLTGKKLFEIHEKYYFEDWGMMNAIHGFSQRNIGAILENVVFIHLNILGYTVHVGALRSLEIDFVAEKDGMIAYFQVCYLLPTPDVVQREYGSLSAIPDQYPKFVVSLDKNAPSNKQGIQHLYLLDFLMRESF